jgi:hypothetical protein
MDTSRGEKSKTIDQTLLWRNMDREMLFEKKQMNKTKD